MLTAMNDRSRPSFERLGPVSDGYATLPVAEAFNWDDCLEDVPPGEWYMVAFRSTRRVDADEARLTRYDDSAHTEAMLAPGFVHYYKGPANAMGLCMSFCLWTSRQKARAASGRPAHVAAAAVTFESYAHYSLEFHRVRRLVDGGFTFEPYDTAPVGETMGGPHHATPVAGFANLPAPS
jgi:hypothetical protein